MRCRVRSLQAPGGPARSQRGGRSASSVTRHFGLLLCRRTERALRTRHHPFGLMRCVCVCVCWLGIQLVHFLFFSPGMDSGNSFQER